MLPSWANDKPVVNKLTGDRLNLRHGPINIVMRVWGGPDAMRNAQRLVFRNFPKLLPAIADDFEALKKATGKKAAKLSSPVTQRMAEAAALFAEHQISPLAAMPSAVAEEVLRMVLTGCEATRAYVGNAGDIALHLAPDQQLACGSGGDVSLATAVKAPGSIHVAASDGVFGIASAGTECRACTLGVAEAVTVLAKSASVASCAATLIAHATNIESPLVKRTPAKKLDPESEYGTQPVTTDVGKLSPEEVTAALEQGARCADAFISSGRIVGAFLQLHGASRTVGAIRFN